MTEQIDKLIRPAILVYQAAPIVDITIYTVNRYDICYTCLFLYILNHCHIICPTEPDEVAENIPFWKFEFNLCPFTKHLPLTTSQQICRVYYRTYIITLKQTFKHRDGSFLTDSNMTKSL